MNIFEWTNKHICRNCDQEGIWCTHCSAHNIVNQFVAEKQLEAIATFMKLQIIEGRNFLNALRAIAEPQMKGEQNGN